MKIKINAKSNSCNCQGSTDSGCASERKSEAPIDQVFAWVGTFLLLGAAIVFFIISATAEETFSLSNLANWGQVAEVFGLMCFSVAMGRWRG